MPFLSPNQQHQSTDGWLMCCTGWAKSKDIQLSKPYQDHFLTALFKALNVERPLLISASMSGRYVLPYIMMPNPETCDERASAFIPLAPVSTPRFTHAQYHRCEVCHVRYIHLLHSVYLPKTYKVQIWMWFENALSMSFAVILMVNAMVW